MPVPTKPIFKETKIMTTYPDHFSTLRRDDREITDKATVEEILHRAEVGRLGLAADGWPYVVPLNYAYHNGAIYFHCADEGRKIDMLTANPQVCFEIDEHYGTVRSNKPSPHSTAYASVIVFGRARLVDDVSEKFEVLQALLDKYAPGHHYRPMRQNEAKPVTVVEIEIEAMTGKARPAFYPGAKVRIRADGEPDERLGTKPYEVETIDDEGFIHLKGTSIRLPWDRFESYFGRGEED
jgi:nitroimidazol reductase NimA-like FMN-containing flavoprotein (pyridoxamine 5'-phosphate oxidase superfamily)